MMKLTSKEALISASLSLTTPLIPTLGLGSSLANLITNLSDQKRTYDFEDDHLSPEEICQGWAQLKFFSSLMKAYATDMNDVLPAAPVLLKTIVTGIELFNINYEYRDCMSQANEYLKSTPHIPQNFSSCAGETGTCTQDEYSA